MGLIKGDTRSLDYSSAGSGGAFVYLKKVTWGSGFRS